MLALLIFLVVCALIFCPNTFFSVIGILVFGFGLCFMRVWVLWVMSVLAILLLLTHWL